MDHHTASQQWTTDELRIATSRLRSLSTEVLGKFADEAGIVFCSSKGPVPNEKVYKDDLIAALFSGTSKDWLLRKLGNL